MTRLSLYVFVILRITFNLRSSALTSIGKLEQSQHQQQENVTHRANVTSASHLSTNLTNNIKKSVKIFAQLGSEFLHNNVLKHNGVHFSQDRNGDVITLDEKTLSVTPCVSDNNSLLENSDSSSSLVGVPFAQSMTQSNFLSNHTSIEQKFQNKSYSNVFRKIRNDDELKADKNIHIHDVRNHSRNKTEQIGFYYNNRPSWYMRAFQFFTADDSSRKKTKSALDTSTSVVGHSNLNTSINPISSKDGLTSKAKRNLSKLLMKSSNPFINCSMRTNPKCLANKTRERSCFDCQKIAFSRLEAREMYLQVLRQQLLDKLRLIPKLKTKPPAFQLPEEIIVHPLYQSDQKEKKHQYYAQVSKVLVFGKDLGRYRLRKNATGSYQFNVSDKVKAGYVKSAALWVFKMPDFKDIYGQTLVITEVHRSHKLHSRLRERSLITTLETSLQNGWVQFDVTRLVRRWISNEAPVSSQLLAIRCKTCHNTNYRAVFGVKNNFLPVIIIDICKQKEEESSRVRRELCDSTVSCCKYELTINFEDLNIHEIVQPRKIRAGYCYGNCNLPINYHYNHTLIVQRLRHSRYSRISNDLMYRTRPCCVPVLLREASIMHALGDGRDLVVSVVPNLLVDRCGCA